MVKVSWPPSFLGIYQKPWNRSRVAKELEPVEIEYACSKFGGYLLNLLVDCPETRHQSGCGPSL